MSDTDGAITTEPVQTVEGRTPTCPRCAYDLSVSVQIWPADQCPTEGTCNECGLLFAWGEVLNPARIPKWLVEYAPLNPLAWLRCALVMLVPWVSMRRLPLALARRPLTLWIMLPAMLLCAYLAIGLAMQSIRFVPQLSNDFFSVRDSLAWPYFIYTEEFIFPDVWQEIVTFVPLVLLVHALLMPLTFLTLDSTLGKANIKLTHLLRVGVLHIQALFMWMLATLLLRSTVAVLAMHGIIDEEGVLHGKIPAIFDPTAHPEYFEYIRSPLLYLVWSLVSWWCVSRFYLRLRWALFHTLVLYFVAALATLAVFVGFTYLTEGFAL